MTFQPASALFEKRSQDITSVDIRYYIEGFFRNALHTDTVYCSVDGIGGVVRIRLRNPLLVQEAVLLERDFRASIKKDLGCDVGSIRVMLG